MALSSCRSIAARAICLPRAPLAALFLSFTVSNALVPQSQKPVATPPIRYFEDKCARCHGPSGTFYGDAFGKNLTEEALRKVVYDMCRVQADSPLAGQDLEAQIAYHRALIVKEPFLAITEIKAGEISGEVTEKAAVSVRFRRSTVSAEVKGARWKVAIPKGDVSTFATVTATMGKVSTVVTLSKQSFSHDRQTPERPVRRSVGGV